MAGRHDIHNDHRTWLDILNTKTWDNGNIILQWVTYLCHLKVQIIQEACSVQWKWYDFHVTQLNWKVRWQ